MPPDSSALVVLAMDTEAEQLADALQEYQANVVTVPLGDELGGLADAVAAVSPGPRGALRAPGPDASA